MYDFNQKILFLTAYPGVKMSGTENFQSETSLDLLWTKKTVLDGKFSD